jgi:hypothetical protein
MKFEIFLFLHRLNESVAHLQTAVEVFTLKRLGKMFKASSRVKGLRLFILLSLYSRKTTPLEGCKDKTAWLR